MSKWKKNKDLQVETEKPVELGFVQEVDDPWTLASSFFASKFGGAPSWLDLKNLQKFYRLIIYFPRSAPGFSLTILSIEKVVPIFPIVLLAGYSLYR